MVAEPAGLSRKLLEAVLELADVLNLNQVQYALVDGLAAGYRTQARFTRDLDFLLKISQMVLPSVLDALEQRGFEFDSRATIREFTQHGMVVLNYHGIRVDWLAPVIPAYQHILDRATEETWLGRRSRVASAEGLILMKLLAGRTQDWLDIENLVAANREALDVAWIQSECQALAALTDPRMVRFLELVERARKLP